MKDKMKTQNLHPAKGERPRIGTWMKQLETMLEED